MRAAAVIAVRLILFLAVSLVLGFTIPWYDAVRDWLPQLMPLRTAVQIGDMLGGIPEPYDAFSEFIAVALNSVLAIVVILLLIKLVRRFKRNRLV